MGNFFAVTSNGENPYDELGPEDLSELTGYRLSLFNEVGKPCIALTLLDEPKMKEFIGNVPGKLKNKEQRALRKNALDLLLENWDDYSKQPVFPILRKYIFPSVFKSVYSKVKLREGI